MKYAMKLNHSKNLHVPLPLVLYNQLRKQSTLSKVPATQIARLAIQSWLEEQRKLSLKNELLEYASIVGGSCFDLDESLEKAAALHLLNHSENPQK